MKSILEKSENRIEYGTLEDETVRVMIADDTEIYCKLVKIELEKFKEIEVIGIANTDDDERKMIEELKPEIVITDLIRHNQYGGLDIIKEYENKESPEFMIASFCPPSEIFTEYKNASSYIMKKLDARESYYIDMVTKFKINKKIRDKKEVFWKNRYYRECKRKKQKYISQDKDTKNYWQIA